MAITRKEEQRLLSNDETEMMEQTRHPQLAQLDPEALRSLAFRLRAQHNRARDLVREARRVSKGKSEARGASAWPDRLLEKKQVFAGGLRRVNAQFARVADSRRKQRNTDALRDALERRRAAQPHHPQAGRHAKRGMRDISHTPAHPGRDPLTIGSVSQATRDNQARRDSRPNG